MALLTEEDVRRMSDNGARGPVVVNRDQVLTPGAKDYLREHRVEVVYPQGRPEGAAKPGSGGAEAPSAPRYQTLFGAALNEKQVAMATAMFGGNQFVTAVIAGAVCTFLWPLLRRAEGFVLEKA